MAIISNNNIDFDDLIGTVLAIDTKTRECSVYIPKLMSGMIDSELVKRKYITNNGINIDESLVNIEQYVTKKNTVQVKASDQSFPMPIIGSKVKIWVIDDNFKLRFWMPFNANGDYDVIPEEKYEKIYTLSIGNKIIDVNKNDNVKIELPENLEIVTETQDKNKIIKIQNNASSYNYNDIEESINRTNYLMDFIKNETISLISAYANPTNLTTETTNLINYLVTYYTNIINDTDTINSLILNKNIIKEKHDDLIDLDGKYSAAVSYYNSNSVDSSSLLLSYNKMLDEFKIIEDITKIIELNSLYTNIFSTSRNVRCVKYYGEETLVVPLFTIPDLEDIIQTNINGTDVLYKDTALKMIQWNNMSENGEKVIQITRDTTIYGAYIGFDQLELDDWDNTSLYKIKYINQTNEAAAITLVIDGGTEITLSDTQQTGAFYSNGWVHNLDITKENILKITVGTNTISLNLFKQE